MATTNTPARTGRRSKLTPATRDAIVEAVRTGNYLETAAAAAGIGTTTLYRWLAEGEAADAPRDKREFREAVTRARAEAETSMVGIVHRAAAGGALLKESTRTLPDGSEVTERQYAPPDGRTALEFMSRAFPDRWPRRSAVEVTGAGGGPIRVEHARVIESLAERLHAELGGGAEDAEVVENNPSPDLT